MRTLCRYSCFVIAIVAREAVAQESPAESTTAQMPSLWDLAIQGGWFMIPIAVASIVTLAFTLERLNGLRRGRILPRGLIRKLRELSTNGNVEPKALWDTAKGFRSPLAQGLRATVLKIGRSQPEVEKAVEDAIQREVGGMTRNLRPINVVASISPLLGLLGTVQGMIMAFMVTSTTTSTGTAKAQELAHGIYTALVTTFAGLAVAVVSVVIANYLEGKIEWLLRQMEEIFLDLVPQLEKFEGKIRVTESSNVDGAEIVVNRVAPPQAVKRSESSVGEKQVSPARKPRSQKRPVVDKPQDNDAKVVVQKTITNTLRNNFDR